MSKEIRLGKYLLFEQLGRGGYGTVYRAQDTVLNVERAVKVLHPALAADPEFIGRFQSEAQLAAHLEHPHIVPVYDLGEASGTVFLAMKYMPAGSLKDLLAREGRLPFERVVEITRQIADALEYANHQPDQLIHRDVKPGNILFEKDGTARLADFGFAKALQSAGTESHSASGALIGTPAYMPPEIWMGQAVTQATDVYSLACVAFEMLTGKSLFGGDSPPPLVMKRHFDSLILPATWSKGVPPGIASVLERALAKDPIERYTGPGEFASALVELLTPKKLLADNPGLKSPNNSERKGEVAHARELTSEPMHYVKDVTRIDKEKTSVTEGLIATQSLPISSIGRNKISSYLPVPKKRIWWPWAIGLGGLIIVVFCIVIGAVVFPGWIASLTVLPTTTSTITHTVVPSPMPTIGLNNLPIPTPTIAIGGDNGLQILLQDNFSNVNSGWDRSHNEYGSTDYENGGYRINVIQVNAFFFANPYKSFQNDVRIEVDATKIGGPDNNAFGVQCHYQDVDNYYFFYISSDGYGGIGRDNAKTKTIISSSDGNLSSDSNIIQGAATNHIRADCIGTNLTLYVNGTQIASATDSTFTGGDVGLIAKTFTAAGTDILFKNFVVLKP